MPIDIDIPTHLFGTCSLGVLQANVAIYPEPNYPLQTNKQSYELLISGGSAPYYALVSGGEGIFSIEGQSAQISQNAAKLTLTVNPGKEGNATLVVRDNAGTILEKPISVRYQCRVDDPVGDAKSITGLLTALDVQDGYAADSGRISDAGCQKLVLCAKQESFSVAVWNALKHQDVENLEKKCKPIQGAAAAVTVR